MRSLCDYITFYEQLNLADTLNLADKGRLLQEDDVTLLLAPNSIVDSPSGKAPFDDLVRIKCAPASLTTDNAYISC